MPIIPPSVGRSRGASRFDIAIRLTDCRISRGYVGLMSESPIARSGFSARMRSSSHEKARISSFSRGTRWRTVNPNAPIRSARQSDNGLGAPVIRLCAAPVFCWIAILIEIGRSVARYSRQGKTCVVQYPIVAQYCGVRAFEFRRTNRSVRALHATVPGGGRETRRRRRAVEASMRV